LFLFCFFRSGSFFLFLILFFYLICHIRQYSTTVLAYDDFLSLSDICLALWWHNIETAPARISFHRYDSQAVKCIVSKLGIGFIKPIFDCFYCLLSFCRKLFFIFLAFFYDYIQLLFLAIEVLFTLLCLSISLFYLCFFAVNFSISLFYSFFRYLNLQCLQLHFF